MPACKRAVVHSTASLWVCRGSGGGMASHLINCRLACTQLCSVISLIQGPSYGMFHSNRLLSV